MGVKKNSKTGDGLQKQHDMAGNQHVRRGKEMPKKIHEVQERKLPENQTSWENTKALMDLLLKYGVRARMRNIFNARRVACGCWLEFPAARLKIMFSDRNKEK